LVMHLAELGVHAKLLTHGVDLEFWQQPVPTEPPEFAGIPRPIVLFWGVIDRRTCTATVRAVAAANPQASLVFRGPQEAPDPELAKFATLGPPVPFERLPALAAAADVLIMPYADLPVTRAIQPLKLKEYLATGKPVVVADLPATRPRTSPRRRSNSRSSCACVFKPACRPHSCRPANGCSAKAGRAKRPSWRRYWTVNNSLPNSVVAPCRALG
jgi:hypothetical protein